MYSTSLTSNIFGLPLACRSAPLFYIDSYCDLFVGAVDVAHLFHVWAVYGLSFTLIDLFLVVHIRQLGDDIYKKIKNLREYMRAQHEIDTRFVFPPALPPSLVFLLILLEPCRHTH